MGVGNQTRFFLRGSLDCDDVWKDCVLKKNSIDIYSEFDEHFLQESRIRNSSNPHEKSRIGDSLGGDVAELPSVCCTQIPAPTLGDKVCKSLEQRL
jgi:hypothetical protein